MSSAGSMIKSVKQNIAMIRSRKNYRFKSHFSKGIFSKVIKENYNFKNISDLELERIKEEIRFKAKIQRRKLLLITISVSLLVFIGLYYFFEIAMR